MKTLFARILCLFRGHRHSWQPSTVFFGEIAKDAAVRTCSCCSRQETQIIPFKRFQITKSN